jgi:hypothetical protein
MTKSQKALMQWAHSNSQKLRKFDQNYHRALLVSFQHLQLTVHLTLPAHSVHDYVLKSFTYIIGILAFFKAHTTL